MSDAASISQFTQSQVAADVSMKVAVKAKNVAKQQGAAVGSLLEDAARLSRTLSSEAGKGSLLDVVG